MANGIHSLTAGLGELPTEILLDIIPKIPWSRNGLQGLRLVCRRFSDIIQIYEHSLSFDLLESQFPSCSSLRFPSLFETVGVVRYDTVDLVQRRWYALARAEKSCYTIRERRDKNAEWMTDRWMKLQWVGLCLLFRLQDCGCSSQATFLETLPSTSLAVLLFTLTLSLVQLRADGPDILHHHSEVQCAAFRAEIELACEELLIREGPHYLVSLLDHAPNAVSVLETEWECMEERQMPCSNGEPKPPTLISVLRRAFSASVHCHIRDNNRMLWDVLHGPRMRDISEDDAVRIIQGVGLSE